MDENDEHSGSNSPGDMKRAPNQLESKQIIANSLHLSLKWSSLNFTAYLDQLDEKLFQLAEKASNNDDQTRYFQSRDEARKHRSIIEEGFSQHLHRAFQHYLKGQPTASDLQPQHSDEENLQLVDTNKLEDALAVSSMYHKASAQCSEHLYILNQRLSVLRGGSNLNERENPIAPAVFGEALQLIFSELILDQHSKLVIYKVFDHGFLRKLSKLYDVLNLNFEKAGVLPNLAYKIKKADEPLPIELQGLQNEISLNHQLKLFSAIHELQVQLHKQLPPGQPQHTNAVPTGQLVQLLQHLQQNSGSQLSKLDNTKAVAAIDLKALRQQVDQQTAKSDHIDANVVEIVGLMFEYMLNDQQFPDAVKAAISYLHTPFLKVALIDKDFFQHPQHPARQLLNSLVAAGERWVEPHSKHKSEVFLQIKSIVERVLNNFNNDIRLFSELAFEFNQFLRQHSRRIRLTEKRSMQAAKGENTLKEIRLKVEAFLHESIGEIQLPPPIKTLLFEPWANFLSFNLLRFGSKTPQWRDAAETVDDILYCCQPYTGWDDRQRLESLQESLPDVLYSGFKTVSYDNTQGKRLIDALLKLQNSETTPTIAPRRV